MSFSSPTGLAEACRALVAARTSAQLGDMVRRAVRELVGADWSTFAERSDAKYSPSEEGCVPFSCEANCRGPRPCLGAWAISNRSAIAISDVRSDGRTAEACESSPVRSLVLVPASSHGRVVIVGGYWKAVRHSSAEEIAILGTLAERAAIALRDQGLFACLLEKRSPLSGPP